MAPSQPPAPHAVGAQALASASASAKPDPVAAATELRPGPMTETQEIQVLSLVTQLGAIIRDQRTEIASLRADQEKTSSTVQVRLNDFDRRLLLAEARGAIGAAMGAATTVSAAATTSTAPPAGKSPVRANDGRNRRSTGFPSASLSRPGRLAWSRHARRDRSQWRRRCAAAGRHWRYCARLRQGHRHRAAWHSVGGSDRAQRDPVAGRAVQGLVNFASDVAYGLATFLPAFCYLAAIALFLFAGWGFLQQARPDNPFRGRPWIPVLSLVPAACSPRSIAY